MATITYKCPNCDGGLMFDPATQRYRCEYCLSSFSQEELDALAPAAASDTVGQPGEDYSQAGAGYDPAGGQTIWAEPGPDAAGAGGAAGAGTAAGTGGAAGAGAAAGTGAAAGAGTAAGTGAATGAGTAAGAGAAAVAGAATAGTAASGAFSGGDGRRAEPEMGGYAQEPADQGGAVLYTCPSCGAEIVTDATTAATFCYYCHNPVVLSGRLEGSYHPDFVIPFQIDRKRAQEMFSQWIAKKKFVPREFYSPKQIETMTGVYFPYWLFNCKVDGNVQGQGTQLRVWTAGNIRYTETKIYDIARQGTVEVNNVARNALKKANRRLVDGVQPFEMGEMQNFSMGYLSGFMAENRDMERAAFETEVAQEVRDFAVSGLKGQGIVYDRIQITNQNADITSGFWQYALLPVWTLTYKDRQNGKIYYFAMNGQSGKVCGELPVDKAKLMILFASIFLPLLIILLILGYII